MIQIARNITILLVFSIILYFDISKWQSTVLGILLLFFYFLYTSKFTKTALVKFFNFSNDSIRTRILSAFLVGIVFSSVGGAVVLFSRLTNLAIAILFFVIGVLSYALHYWSLKSSKEEKGDNLLRNIKEKIKLQMPKAKVGVFVYVILWFLSLVILLGSRQDGNFLSPWQVINEWYIYAFFTLTAIVGLLIFSKLTSRSVLFLLILHAFLLHSYLPLTNNTIYGTDQWRHMAVENQIVAEQSINIQMVGDTPVNYLQSLDPGKLAYSQLWSAESITAKVLDVDLITVNKWLVALLFSLLIPILLYELGLTLNFGPRKRLLLVWLSFLFFPLQSLGSVTLPVSFGFLSFLFLLLLILKREQRPRKEQLILLTILFFLSFFGYSLYVILFGMFWFVIEMIEKRGGEKMKYLNKVKVIFLTIFSIVLIPLVEIFSRYSLWSTKISFTEQIQQFIGNILGIYVAVGPRTHDILGGNIFFNQIPSYAYVSNVFTDLRILIPLLMAGFLLVILMGFVVSVKDKRLHWLSVMSVGLCCSYFIGMYILTDQRLLSRRLDLTLALILLLLLTMGLYKILVGNEKDTNFKIVTAIIIFSFAITLSYSLGPDTKSVSTDDVQAMKYVWQEIKNDKEYCVISDTYSLLALETVSKKKVIGGGFPVNRNYTQVQSARVTKTVESITEQTPEYLEKYSLGVTGAKRCFFVDTTEIWKKNSYYSKKWKFKNIFGKVQVWEYNEST